MFPRTGLPGQPVSLPCTATNCRPKQPPPATSHQHAGKHTTGKALGAAAANSPVRTKASRAVAAKGPVKTTASGATAGSGPIITKASGAVAAKGPRNAKAKARTGIAGGLHSLSFVMHA